MTSAPLPANGTPWLAWDADTRQLVTPTEEAAIIETEPAEASKPDLFERVIDRCTEHSPIVTAAVATGMSYAAMVRFGTNEMGLPKEYALLGFGVLELALTTFALLARRDAKRGQSTTVMMTIVLALSIVSGTFATLEQHAKGTALWASCFWYAPPLVAAIVWHFALTGERVHSTGRTLADIRADMAVNRFVERSIDLGLLTAPGVRSWAIQRKVARVRLIRARRAMGRRVPVARIEQMVAARRAAVEAANAAGQQVGVTAREWTELVGKRVQMTTAPEADMSDGQTGDRVRPTGQDMSSAGVQMGNQTGQDTRADSSPAASTPVKRTPATRTRRTTTTTPKATVSGDKADRDAKIVSMLIEGRKHDDIADVMGVTTKTIQRVRRSHEEQIKEASK